MRIAGDGQEQRRRGRDCVPLGRDGRKKALTNTTGTGQFDDPSATNRPERFYRVVVP